MCNVCHMVTGMDLKVERVKARLRQHQIAERTGLSRSWVAKVEGITGQVPSAMSDRYDAALRTFGIVRGGER